jgi:hypothetical protein
MSRLFPPSRHCTRQESQLGREANRGSEFVLGHNTLAGGSSRSKQVTVYWEHVTNSSSQLVIYKGTTYLWTVVFPKEGRVTRNARSLMYRSRSKKSYALLGLPLGILPYPEGLGNRLCAAQLALLRYEFVRSMPELRERSRHPMRTSFPTYAQLTSLFDRF